MRMKHFVVAAFGFGALFLAAPAWAMTWDEFLNDATATGASWFSKAKETAVDQYKKATGVAITACFASDWTAFMDNPGVTAAWEKQTGNRVEFPRDPKHIFLGSGDILAKWDDGSLPCDVVGPDVGVVGYRSANWDMDQTVLIAASFPVAVIPNEVLDPVLKYLKKTDAHDLSFLDLVKLAGTPWEQIDPTKKHWGDFRVATTDPLRSGSSSAVITSLAYEAAQTNKLSGRDVTKPEILDALAAYRKNVAHEQPSTGELTQAFILNPNDYHVIFTYESRIPQIKKEMEATFIYSQYVVQADRRALVTSTDEKRRAVTISFLDWLESPQVQTIVASDKLALRPSRADVPVGDFVKVFKQERFNAVRPGRDVVQAVLHEATKKDRQ